MTNLPDLMRRYADAAERLTFDAQTAGGLAFRRAFAEFVRVSAEDDREAILGDFLRVVARQVIEMQILLHENCLCIECLETLCDTLAEEISVHADALVEQHKYNPKGAH